MQAAYNQPLSLWKLVEQHAQPHEQDELKDMLGNSLVEQSLELHAEIDMLLEIWRDVREETAESMEQLSILPEPPNQRDRLVQEICFFVENVKEQAKKKGIDPEHILKHHNPEILDYVSGQSRPDSARSRTSRLSDGRETPMTVLSPERLDLAYNMTDEVEAVNKHLNFLDFSGVCTSLRSYLEKEVEQLLEDVQFLQTCLDEAADTRDCPTPALTSREPTLTELREQRSMLEKELFATEKISSTPVVSKAIFNTSNRVLPKTPPTPTKGQRSSPCSPPPARIGPVRTNTRTTPGPLKASHDVMLGLNSQGNDISTSYNHSSKADRDSNLQASGSNSSINFSTLSIDSSPSLDEDLFLFSDSNADTSTSLSGNELKAEAASSRLVPKHHAQPSHTVHHKRSAQTSSKSGSCLDSGKSPLATVLPSPCILPPGHSQQTATATSTDNPAPAVPSHSDSDLAHQPVPPSGRPDVAGSNRSRRRTVSPRPRFRVVDVTNLVEAHGGKGDSELPCVAAERVINFTSSSSASSVVSGSSSASANTVSPLDHSPSDGMPEREPRIRPGSANRFREMVLGCRDGQ